MGNTSWVAEEHKGRSQEAQRLEVMAHGAPRLLLYMYQTNENKLVLS